MKIILIFLSELYVVCLKIIHMKEWHQYYTWFLRNKTESVYDKNTYHYPNIFMARYYFIYDSSCLGAMWDHWYDRNNIKNYQQYKQWVKVNTI